MIPSETPGSRRLFDLLNGIIGEEQNFKADSPDSSIQYEPLNISQSSASDETSVSGEFQRIRLTHEALFKIHRKFISEHELLIERCFVISRQARAGLLRGNRMRQ